MLCVGTDTFGRSAPFCYCFGFRASKFEIILVSLGQALRGNDVKAAGMNRRRAPIRGRPHAERRDEKSITVYRSYGDETRNTKFEIRNYPGSVTLVPMLCVGTNRYPGCFEIRNSKLSCFLVPMLCVGTDTFGRSASFCYCFGFRASKFEIILVLTLPRCGSCWHDA